MNKINMKQALKNTKINLAETIILDFCEVNSNWLSKIKSIQIDSDSGDSLVGYRFSNVHYINGISKNDYLGVISEDELLGEEFDEEQSLFYLFIDLFNEIKNEIDEMFLYYKRDNSRYIISGDNFPKELHNFIVNNIW